MRRTLLTVLALAAPRAALACPVCFGQNDSPLAAGINLGIFAMLGVTGAVLAGFASFFIYLMRKGRAASALNEVAVAGFAPEQAGTVDGRFATHPQGGAV